MDAKFKIKNHVSKKAKRISGMLKGKFGLDLSDLDRALQGDKRALEAIGEAARQGKQIQELMPLLEEAYGNLIKGTETYNKGVSNILKQGANSAINIDKATGQASLANTKYGNQRKEIKAEYIGAARAELQRHNYAINYTQLKSYIDFYMAGVDGDARLIEQTNRPELRQIEEDKRFEMNTAKHLLQNGSEARLDLLPAREYIPSDSSPNTPKVEQAKGIMQSLGRIVSALGF
jgi:hypothetical protein